MRLICFSVFCVYECCFYFYILTIIAQSRFLFYYQIKNHFVVQILINIFLPIKIKTNIFGISYCSYIFSYCYNDLMKLLLNFVVILLLYKRYYICLILFFNLFELFRTFNCTIHIGSLVNSFFGGKICNPYPSFTSSSSPSSSGMSSTSFSSSVNHPS